jgi:hypothetical protein
MHQSYPGSSQLPGAQHPALPASVRNAVTLMYAGAVASLIYAVVYIATLNTTKTLIARRSPSLSVSQLAARQHSLLAVAVVSGLIEAGLWLFLSQGCRRGRNWARITGTVLFGLATLDLFGLPVFPEAALNKVLAVLIWLMGLGAVVLLWRGRSTAFFRASRGQQSAGQQ